MSSKTQNIHQQKKLKREDLPWLEIPSDDMLEPNTWDPSCKEVGRGDPIHFFGIQEELEMETTRPENLSEKRHQLLLKKQSLHITKIGKNATKPPDLEH